MVPTNAEELCALRLSAFATCADGEQHRYPRVARAGRRKMLVRDLQLLVQALRGR